MEWTPGGVSNDIEDRRDEGGGGGGGFGGFHMGIGGFILLAILSLVFHRNLFVLFSGAGSAPVQDTRENRQLDQGEQPKVQFVSFVLDDVQKTWERILPEQEHTDYRHAKLDLFRGVVRSACGQARSAMGPFYCPEDERVYLDLSFLDELKSRFGAPGEFAQAYVIAHELGHHVQKILGIEPKVRRLQEQSPDRVNALSVRLELQADCLAGVWGHTTEQRHIINENDIDEGLAAAASVGDDRLQKQTTGTINPESFTHGTSAQRTHWFRQGLDSGQVSGCSTFSSAM